MPISAGTERTREARARQRAGLVRLHLWVNEAALHDTLLAHKLIGRDGLDSRADVSTTASRALESLALVPIVET